MRCHLSLPPMGYTKAQLAICRGATIPDLIGKDCRLLFVGINPGLQTAMTGIHFAHPTNRFWPALKKAGLIDWLPELSPAAPAVPLDEEMNQGRKDRWSAATGTHFCHPSNPFCPALRAAGLIELEGDTSVGMSDDQRTEFTGKGMGITNLVSRATVRASELTESELVVGGTRLRTVVEQLHPVVVAVAGVTAYRTAFGERLAALGRQPHPMAGSELWVIPNPSGLNAHETLASLARWHTHVADAAGVK